MSAGRGGDRGDVVRDKVLGCKLLEVRSKYDVMLGWNGRLRGWVSTLAAMSAWPSQDLMSLSLIPAGPV